MQNISKVNELLHQFVQESLRSHAAPMRRPKNGNITLEIYQHDGLIKKIILKESYVVHVLGIKKKRLMESLGDADFRRKVLYEHLLFEGWWDSAKQFVGDAVDNIKDKAKNAADILKRYGENTKGVVAALWAAVNDERALDFLKSAFSSYMDKQVKDINVSIHRLKARVGELGMPDLAKILEGATNKISSIAEKFGSVMGWKGLMTTAAGLLGFQWIKNKILPGLQVVREALKGNVEDFVQMMADKAADIAVEYKDVFDVGPGNPKDVIVPLIKEKLANLIPNVLKEKLQELAGDAIANLAGPVGWLKKAYDIFQKSDWVLNILTSAINRANFKV